MGAHLTIVDPRMSDRISQKHKVPEELGQKRLDQIAAELFSDYSRSRIQEWIKQGALTVDGMVLKPRTRLVGGETLLLDVDIESEGEWEAQDIPVEVVYCDEHIIVINKPLGLVVHPGAGNPDGTLVNALLFKFPDLRQIPRAGVVHRLDKDTTGLMVVARSLLAHQSLVNQLQSREMGREYEAVCQGVLTGGGEVDEPISRHSQNRLKMTVHPTGKEAITHYRVLKRYRHHTYIRLKLETGRTHQIRVHMTHINHPLVGDPLYGGRQRVPGGLPPDIRQFLQQFKRQALHARQLELIHPVSGDTLVWKSELPDDFVELLDVLDKDLEDEQPE